MWKYIRYFMMPGLLLATIAGFMLGGPWLWLGFCLTLVVVVGGDAIAGKDLKTPVYGQRWIFNFVQMFLNFSLLLAMLAVFAWMLGAEGTDVLGLGAFVQSQSGWDMQAARATISGWDIVGGVLGLGLLIATAGTANGHDLTHRTWDKTAMLVGRWMLAMSCDASFAIEHVYGHHVNIGTLKDPATAKRGENAYAFVIRSTIYSYLSAWRIEKERLAKRGLSVWSWRNRMHTGNLMSLTYFVGFYLAAGWFGVGVFLVASLWAKSLLEYVNYMEHYGIVRVPGTKVEPRHSWNANQRISGFVLFNLTRHSHHHAEADVPFWELRPYPDAPMLKYGYLTMIIITMVPPLYRSMMTPKLRDWDKRFASPAERKLAQEANAASGIPELMNAASA